MFNNEFSESFNDFIVFLEMHTNWSVNLNYVVSCDAIDIMGTSYVSPKAIEDMFNLENIKHRLMDEVIYSAIWCNKRYDMTLYKTFIRLSDSVDRYYNVVKYAGTLVLIPNSLNHICDLIDNIRNNITIGVEKMSIESIDITNTGRGHCISEIIVSYINDAYNYKNINVYMDVKCQYAKNINKLYIDIDVPEEVINQFYNVCKRRILYARESLNTNLKKFVKSPTFLIAEESHGNKYRIVLFVETDLF